MKKEEFRDFKNDYKQIEEMLVDKKLVDKKLVDGFVSSAKKELLILAEKKRS